MGIRSKKAKTCFNLVFQTCENDEKEQRRKDDGREGHFEEKELKKKIEEVRGLIVRTEGSKTESKEEF